LSFYSFVSVFEIARMTYDLSPQPTKE